MVNRLFIAIDLPENVRSSIHNLCRGLNNVRWVTEDQIHLTLRFLGEVDGVMKNDICEALSGLNGESFSLQIRGVGHFPLRGDPRVLWAGVEDNPHLQRLHRSINNSIGSCGVEVEHRKFAPHITLGRVRNERSDAIAAYLGSRHSFTTDKFEVNQYHLYSSFLTEKGAIHEKLATFELSR